MKLSIRQKYSEPVVIIDTNFHSGIYFDSTDAGMFLAVSVDGNPLDGFPYVYDLTAGIGGFPDYQKAGFNKDAIFISYNNFGIGGPFLIL